MLSSSKTIKRTGRVPAERNPGNSYNYWLRIVSKEAFRKTEHRRSGAFIRVEPEKMAFETVSSQSSSNVIVVRTKGMEADFPSVTDIGILVAIVKTLNHD